MEHLLQASLPFLLRLLLRGVRLQSCLRTPIGKQVLELLLSLGQSRAAHADRFSERAQLLLLLTLLHCLLRRRACKCGTRYLALQAILRRRR